MRKRSRGKFQIALAGLALAATTLSGCVAGRDMNPEPLEEKVTEKAAPAGPSVERLPEGREGFIIREVSQMDAQARADFDRAVALIEKEQYSEAVELLIPLVEAFPGVTAPYINLAIACRKTGKTEEAEAHLKSALELIPDHPVASNEYGLLLRKGGRFGEARTVYQQAIAAYPEYLPLHKNLGILCDLYLNDLTCALEQYEIYHQAVPEDQDVEIWVADLRMRLGVGQGQGE